MEERLYQPDFSCIFGEKFANAFIFPQVDSLVWPIFEDIEKSNQLKNLLSLQNPQGRGYFYTRRITVEDEIVELSCANLNMAFLQAMDLGREYGILNEDVITAVRKNTKTFKAILSFNLSDKSNFEHIIGELNKYQKECDVIGIVVYPTYTNLDLSKLKNSSFSELLAYLKTNELFLKIDIGNYFFPNFYDVISKEKLQSFLSLYQENIVILSGLDLTSDITRYYPLLKYFNNVWLEIDPRTFGGTTPTDVFTNLFKMDGFVQNCWSRILIGSATPTLEISQVVRGFYEASESLTFSQRSTLRSWAFRNVVRLNSRSFASQKDSSHEYYKTLRNIELKNIIETDTEVEMIYKVKLRSYSITQLIFLTDLFKTILGISCKKYGDFKNGEMFVRSYHTTTTLVINEHEYGNYLDLHYAFAEISKKDSSEFLHTVRALENRADFNHYDHELASTYGSRQLILPILDGKFEIGSRENFYVLVTFGPRTFNLFVRVKMIK
ncbi:MAG: hypothetical protein GF383_15790 [Candidatus Lokiarchaeota archaeon]|nr:hypothetical protein [Candidatus Lokiarchaeota archaeon]MBD3343162.1 hypothetical protein [Candidatus Lokiarchaeota archaeon]